LSSPYKDMTFDHEDTAVRLQSAIQTPSEFLVLVVNDSLDLPVGFLIATKSKLPFIKELVLTEIAWHVRPEYRNFRDAKHMLRIYEEWGRAVKCSSAQVAKLTTSGPVDVLYRRQGYTEVETSYKKEL
jgi:GNAT superfamily N-acetyltransferase